MIDFAKRLLQIRLQALKPNSRRTVLDWAKEERTLGPDSSSQPGPWRPVFEGAVEPLLSVTKRGVRQITVMTSAQLMKSDFILNTLGYFLGEDPSNVILAQPSEKAAEDFSRTRVSLLVRDTPILAENTNEADNQVFLKQFATGGKVNLVSAAAPSDLASRSARVILMDEIDRYRNLSKEGDPEQLLAARATTFWNSLVIAVSTPTADGTSRIAKRFAQSSQGYFHARCPYCENLEKPEWENVRWENNDASTAAYVCSHCENPWSENDRHRAVRLGEYVHLFPEKTDHLGFTANCIVSPFQPLSHFVGLFLEAKKDVESLRSFVNLQLAETFKPKADAPDHERLYERRESCALGTVPKRDVRFLTMGVDVQADRLECQIVGWTKDKQSYSIDYRVIVGMTHTDQPWLELKALIESQFPVEESSRTLPIALTVVDSGFNTQKVYEFVQKFSPNKVRAIKGTDNLQMSFKMGSDLNVRFDGQKDRYAHKVWIVGSSHLKTDFFAKLRLPVAGDDGLYPPGFCHFPEYESQFFKGLASEALVLDKGKYVWTKLHPRNEPLDTWIYARAAAAIYGLDRFKEIDWQRLAGDSTEPHPTVRPLNKPISPARPNHMRNPSGLWKNPGLKRRF